MKQAQVKTGKEKWFSKYVKNRVLKVLFSYVKDFTQNKGFSLALAVLKSYPFHIDGLLSDRYNLFSALFQPVGVYL